VAAPELDLTKEDQWGHRHPVKNLSVFIRSIRLIRVLFLTKRRSVIARTTIIYGYLRKLSKSVWDSMFYTKKSRYICNEESLLKNVSGRGPTTVFPITLPLLCKYLTTATLIQP
jgi:hypothetical protein